MAKLSPYALQIPDALTRRDKVFAKAYEANPLFNELDNYAHRVSPFKRFPGMTDRVPKPTVSLVDMIWP